MNKTDWYILDERRRPQEVLGCNSKGIFENWAALNPHLVEVATTQVGRFTTVTTVFIGVDVGIGRRSTSFAGYNPIVFRSCVRGGVMHGIHEYYTSWEQAERGHHRIVNRCRGVQFSLSNYLILSKRRFTRLCRTAYNWFKDRLT